MAIGYWKGKKLSKETREKMSMAKKGKMPSNIKLFREARKVYKITEADRKKMSDSQKKAGSIPPSRRGTIPWNYRGATKLQEQIRKCFEYRQWRSDIFTRDNFTCQRCGFFGGKINADHIKLFSLILKENCILTLAESLMCEELWNVNNGRTLCVPCHQSRKAWDEEMMFLEEL